MKTVFQFGNCYLLLSFRILNDRAFANKKNINSGITVNCECVTLGNIFLQGIILLTLRLHWKYLLLKLGRSVQWKSQVKFISDRIFNSIFDLTFWAGIHLAIF